MFVTKEEPHHHLPQRGIMFVTKKVSTPPVSAVGAVPKQHPKVFCKE